MEETLEFKYESEAMKEERTDNMEFKKNLIMNLSGWYVMFKVLHICLYIVD